MTFAGLDLHKRYITACALDAAGVVVGELRRLPAPWETSTGSCSGRRGSPGRRRRQRGNSAAISIGCGCAA
jgi:hypothetical protein